MNETVTLRHERLKGDRIVHFYDGLLVAKDSLLSIPADRPLWIYNAFITGWNVTPDGEKIWNKYQLEAEIERQTSGTPELTAESAKEEKNEVPEKKSGPVISVPARKKRETSK